MSYTGLLYVTKSYYTTPKGEENTVLKFLSPLHKASRQISLYFEEQMAGMELSPVEGHILSYLRSYAPCPIAELVRVFGLKQSTLTSMLDRLEKQEFIARELNPDDRRSFLVKITRRGQAMANRLQGTVDDLERQLGRQVSAEDIAGFERVMAAIDGLTEVEVRRKR